MSERPIDDAPARESPASDLGRAARMIGAQTQAQATIPTVVPRLPLHTVLTEYAAQPHPAPAAELAGAGFVWGLAQPLLGLRTLVRERELLVRAIVPVLGFIVVCMVIADTSGGAISWVGAYYLTLIGAAPLSPVLFCRNYARLAASARPHLELEAREPYLRGWPTAITEAIRQLVILGVGVAPLAALVAVIPMVGWIWAGALGYLWVLHWIVVEAFDSAKTLDAHGDVPGPPSAELPWYGLPSAWRVSGWTGLLTVPLRVWSGWLAGLGRPWRSEVALIEGRPWIAAGFAVGSALLLAIPVLNLLFRPAVVVAAAHVLGRLEAEELAAGREPRSE